MQTKKNSLQTFILFLKIGDKSAIFGMSLRQSFITTVKYPRNKSTLFRKIFNAISPFTIAFLRETSEFFFSFYVGFLSRTFKNHRTAEEGRGYFINSSLPLPYFHQLHRHLDNSRAITAESSPLHVASSWTRTGNLWFPSASR